VHGEHCYLSAGKQEPSRNRPGQILLVGDFFHSLVDGSLIVAAFSAGGIFGAVVTAAIIAHEIPRKCATGADAGPLRTQSWSGAVPWYPVQPWGAGGGVAAWASLGSMHNATPLLLWGAAAMMIYVVVVEMMPIMRSGGHSLVTFKQRDLCCSG